ncbi:acyltransferase family protein [uncultured Castellaniella sp.]|uniref:acyltransferase family protein n=1 Tax=uncultured Castellaniella sp. TaxID=647907 RepID=UPI0026017C7F|nr:acyltransferase family protein [uncultured Castellaniella sp.]
MSQHNLKYRPDIDGLRAIAVICVLAYHAFPGIIPSGYIGVDVFFVISGYLISTLILQAVHKGRFSFLDFYKRRINRIFPALALVLLSTLAFGWLVLFPDEYAQLGKHAAGGAGFVANLIFMTEAGYFDNAGAAKPLLHFWSLGVEEQFYLLWPILIIIAQKARQKMAVLICVLGAASFFYNIWLINIAPIQTFYSPVTRFWELMFGGLLAHNRIHRHWIATPSSNRKKHAYAANILTGTGLALILVAAFWIPTASAFPGWWGLLPATGAALIIFSGTESWLNRRVFSHRVAVWIGLISYPLYLWHWPLLSFLFILSGGSPSEPARFAAIAASVLLAWATFRYVEPCFRHARATTQRTTLLALTVLFTGALGYAIYALDGISSRSVAQNAQGKTNDLIARTKPIGEPCPRELTTHQPAMSVCIRSRPELASYAIFGDSHAEHLYSGISAIDSSRSWLLIEANSCPPVTGIDVIGTTKNCRQRSERALAFLNGLPDIRTVVLSFYGNYFLDTSYAADHIAKKVGPAYTQIRSDTFHDKTRKELFVDGLRQTIDTLEQNGKSVVLVIDVPELPFFPRTCIPRGTFTYFQRSCTLKKTDVMLRQQQLREVIQQLRISHPKLRVFDPLQFMCDEATCKFDGEKMLLYRDSNHLSSHGSLLFAKEFIPWLHAGR